jgi:hypothetical protein
VWAFVSLTKSPGDFSGQLRGWLTRRDSPGSWERAADVCALYLDPPEGAVVLSIDEKTAIAARSRP